MRIAHGITVLIMAAALAGGAWGDAVTLQLKDASLETTAAKLAAQTGAYVFADPAVDTKITVSLNAVPLQRALDVICAGAELDWYLVKMDLPEGAEPDAKEVAGIIRFLATVGSDTIVTERPSGEIAARIQRGAGAEALIPEMAEAGNLARIYLLTSADLKAPLPPPSNVDRMMDLQRESMKLMVNLSQDEMAQMMQRSLEMFLNMDPQQRSALMNQSLGAITKMNPETLKAMAGEVQSMVRDIQPETLESLMKMWGWDPENQGRPPFPPGE